MSLRGRARARAITSKGITGERRRTDYFLQFLPIAFLF